jgi:hypothetical protein
MVGIIYKMIRFFLGGDRGISPPPISRKIPGLQETSALARLLAQKLPAD